MRGLMMDYPLTLHHLFDRGTLIFGEHEIISRVPGGKHSYTYADFRERTQRLAGALRQFGIQPGDRVGTLAWNHYRHLELYFGVPCMGAVLHTLNLRLPADQLAYIIHHAGDRVIVADRSLLPLLESIKDQIPNVERIVVMSDEPGPVETSLGPVDDYETLLANAEPMTEWPKLDENDAAAMCYTSGTTGHPKGVLYSHRAIFLHAMGAAQVDSAGISQADVVMPVVPMFHANAWGMPFAATLVGAKQVFPGAAPTPTDLAQLIHDERVTVAAGVPTIWMGVLQVLQSGQYDVSSIRCMPCGGSAPPPALMAAYEQQFGVQILHAWGMTEMSPIGSISTLKPRLRSASPDVRFAYQTKQGLPVPGIELKAIDAAGNEVPHDGRSMGELIARGPWVAATYYNDDRSADSFTPDGWFRTGDIVTIDPDGYIQITDRAKDVIKSGGEWISSVELENTIMGHPKVAEAAVIAVPHERWMERPLACVVRKPDGQNLTKEELIDYLVDRGVARWWLPDDVVFVPEIPKTSVGKFDKKVLRAQQAAGSLVPA